MVVGILKACEARLLGMTDMEKMVDFLRGEVPRWPHDKLQVPPHSQLLCESCECFFQLADLRSIR